MNTSAPVVLFDGVCHFCNSTIDFLIRQDQKAALRFAALQSDAGQQLLQQYGLPQDGFGSFVLIAQQKAFQRSTAALKLLPYLPWYWQWARILWLVPLRLRDAVYNLVASNRYRWFGKRETCMIPDASVRARFLE